MFWRLLSSGAEGNQFFEMYQIVDTIKTRYFHHTLSFECCSGFRFEPHLFARLAVLVQEIAYERFDWTDAVVGRNVRDACFRIRLLHECERRNASRIKFELKALESEHLEELKKQFLNIIDIVFSFYPGLFFDLVVSNDPGDKVKITPREGEKWSF